MNKSRGAMRGLQFISYAKLACDILEWSKSFARGYYRSVVGVPRSGLTCAHMLSVHLDLPCTALHAREFRQSTGRTIRAGQGPVLVVDDTASYGTTMREVRSQLVGTPAEFAAVYARKRVSSTLDHWYDEHKEPDWLVITEWNWYRHQDAEYIAITEDVLSLGFEANPRFDAVYHSSLEAARQFKHSMAAVLFAVQHCQDMADESRKPVVDAATMQIHLPRE